MYGSILIDLEVFKSSSSFLQQYILPLWDVFFIWEHMNKWL